MAEETVEAKEETPEAKASTEEASVVEEESTEVESTEETKVEESEDETKVPVRNNASYIIQRKDKKIAKLEEQLGEKDSEKETPANSEDRLDRMEGMLESQAEERELTALFEKEPDAKRYEKEIREYMSHDSYKKAALEVIYHHVSHGDTASKKASKKAAADLEADQTKSAGSGVRGAKNKDEKTADDIKNMTTAEFVDYEREQQKLARA